VGIDTGDFRGVVNGLVMVLILLGQGCTEDSKFCLCTPDQHTAGFGIYSMHPRHKYFSPVGSRTFLTFPPPHRQVILAGFFRSVAHLTPHSPSFSSFFLCGPFLSPFSLLHLYLTLTPPLQSNGGVVQSISSFSLYLFTLLY